MIGVDVPLTVSAVAPTEPVVPTVVFAAVYVQTCEAQPNPPYRLTGEVMVTVSP